MKRNINDGGFFELVYEIVQIVPKGRVTTYGAIAKVLGAARSARLVGTAMMFAHDSKLMVPAHRVVNRNGLLTGKHHFETPDQMQLLLESEGVVVIDDQIQNFKEVFWDPQNEL